jgi:urate oxidase
LKIKKLFKAPFNQDPFTSLQAILIYIGLAVVAIVPNIAIAVPNHTGNSNIVDHIMVKLQKPRNQQPYKVIIYFS